MSNILVTGAHGPLGNEMQRLAEQDAENMYVFTDVAELDITDLDAIRRCMTEYRISIVVNCAAICDIRSCHSDEFPSKVKKPAFSVLDKTKVKKDFYYVIPYRRDSLVKCNHELDKI